MRLGADAVLVRTPFFFKSQMTVEALHAHFHAVADDTIKQRLVTTGQLLNVGGPEEFAKSIEEQRSQVAAFAKELGIAELPQD